MLYALSTSSRSRALLCVALLALAACSGKKQQARADAQDTLSQFDQEGDGLDAPVRPGASKPKSAGMLMIPGAPAQPSVPIDGEPTGWKLEESARTFEQKSMVESGARHWRGARDASLKIAVQADAGWAYFWLEVKDDTIIEAQDRLGNPVDGVLLWLRDPGLHKLAKSLPDGVAYNADIAQDVGLLFTPDGTVREAQGRELVPGAVTATPFKKKGAWGVEVAISLEVFAFVSQLPMEQLAFRAEVLDGDDPKRLGVQTRLSMIPGKDEHGEPRFALYGAGGLLPHREASSQVYAPEAIGYWERGATQWRQVSLEVLPRTWGFFEGADAFMEEVAAGALLDEACNPARHERHVSGVMESRSGRHRTGLLECAAIKVEGKCAAGARTKLFWMHLVSGTEQGQAWELKQLVEVLPKTSLKQCHGEAERGEPLYQNFSMTPLEFLGAQVWVLGWQRTVKQPDYTERVDGAWIFSTARRGRVHQLIARSDVAEEQARVVSRTTSHFVDVDEEQGLDLCELERIQEQTCGAHDRECETDELGRSVQVHLHTWSPKVQAFDRYMLSKHPRCKHDFDFSSRPGYLLLHTGERVGVLRSSAKR